MGGWVLASLVGAWAYSKWIEPRLDSIPDGWVIAGSAAVVACLLGMWRLERRARAGAARGAAAGAATAGAVGDRGARP